MTHSADTKMCQLIRPRDTFPKTGGIDYQITTAVPNRYIILDETAERG